MLRLTLKAMISAGELPVFQHLDQEGHRERIERPHECLEELPEELVFFDQPLEDASRVGLSLKGALVGDLSHGVLDAFLKTLAALAKQREVTALPSPTQAQPVVAYAHELWLPEMKLPSDLMVIGMLLESEGIGSVGWTSDRTSPWSVEVDHRIRDYGSVVTLADYLRIRYPDDP